MDLWRSIGGMDEAFDEPGAGYANLDLFRRAVDRSSEIISLVGEASFHQYHSGTTTNVDDDRKDALVRGFLNNYRALRGGDFKNVEPNEIYVRGRIRTDQALTARQHLLFPGGVGVTHAIRPGDGAQLFDGASQNYLRSAYIECGLHKETQWLGKPVDLAPADLTSLQEIIRRVRPERIVVADSTEGVIGFVADQVRLLDLDETRIAHVWRSAANVHAVTAVRGVPEDPAVIDAVRAFVGGAERVLVLFEPSEADELPIDTLAAYAELVSWGSYLVFLRSGIGQPYLGYSRNWRLAAIHRLVARGAFSIDPSFEGQLLTLCPRGFLRRTAGLVKAAPYDAQLDKLDQF
jgi:cephalosporin hydroxylase